MAEDRLRAIGFWKGSGAHARFHNPQEFVSDSEAEEAIRSELIRYLRTGRCVEACFGCSWCRFECGIDESLMGTLDLSDGIWVWPEGLAHYVDVHRVRLPSEFVRAATSTSPIRRKVSPHGLPGEYDFEFWQAWCAKNTSGDPRATGIEYKLGPRRLVDPLEVHREFWISLGEEVGPEQCRAASCERLRITLSVSCRRHHFEKILRQPCPFE